MTITEYTNKIGQMMTLDMDIVRFIVFSIFLMILIYLLIWSIFTLKKELLNIIKWTLRNKRKERKGKCKRILKEN